VLVNQPSGHPPPQCAAAVVRPSAHAVRAIHEQHTKRRSGAAVQPPTRARCVLCPLMRTACRHRVRAAAPTRMSDVRVSVRGAAFGRAQPCPCCYLPGGVSGSEPLVRAAVCVGRKARRRGAKAEPRRREHPPRRVMGCIPCLPGERSGWRACSYSVVPTYGRMVICGHCLLSVELARKSFLPDRSVLSAGLLPDPYAPVFPKF
jgi:hypothetical protein